MIGRSLAGIFRHLISLQDQSSRIYFYGGYSRYGFDLIEDIYYLSIGNLAG